MVLCCLFGTIVYTQEWITFTKSTPEPPIIDLIESNNQKVEFNVEICGMYKNDITEDSELFQRVEVPGAGKTSETGSPELPYIRKLIAIPECDDVILTANITGQTDFNNFNIYPAPGYEEVEEPDGAVYMQEVFTKDETVYAENTYLPGMNAEIVSTGYLRDQKYAEIFLYPIQFNPVLKSIDVFTQYQVTLDFVNPTSPVNVNTGIFNNVASNTMLNYVSSGMKASVNDNVQGNGNVQWVTLTDTAEACTIVADYLIICADPFFEPTNPESEVLRIANHRATYNGFDIAILEANNIISMFYDQENFPFEKERAIRHCIRRIYEGANAQHTYDGKLGYVLLIGDVEHNSNLGMPTSYEYTSESFGINYPSDYYFTCITNDGVEYDEIGDLYIGRFCVNNDITTGPVELHNMVSKTICFETEYTFDEWRYNTFFVNGTWIPNSYHQMYHEYFAQFFLNYPEYNHDYSNYYLNSINQPTINAINTGCVYLSYFGHGQSSGWQNALSSSNILNNTQNNYKTPVVLSMACLTGKLDGITDSFSEEMTTVSLKGFAGILASPRVTYACYTTNISLPPVSLQTGIPYSIWHNLSHVTGEFILESKIYTNNEVHKYCFNYFGDPALNIMAQGFEVTQDMAIPSLTTISSEISVKNEATLTIPHDGILYFENNGKLIIEEGSTLYINRDVQIFGNDPSQQILINGFLEIAPLSPFGTTLSFVAPENSTWGGIKLSNISNNYDFNTVSFENCFLSGESKKLTVINSSFNNSGLKYQKGDLVIENSNFDNSKIEAVYGNSKSSYVEITSNCTVQNCEQEPAIYIDGYYNYLIDDCTISGNSGDGIGIFNSGDVKSTKEIKNNTIINNGLEDLGAGIEIYHSYVNIYGDQLIEGNNYGISCFNNSNISIRGNSSANYIYETQIIRDNEKHQIYATQNSFPYDFRWNAVINEDNQYPLVYYSSSIEEELDVRNNYWGENFEPEDDLYPFSFYTYLPIWELNSGSGGNDDAEAMYNSAQVKIIQGDYTGAKADFQQIIINYPTSKFAQAALKELFSLEEYISDDYSGLKDYYISETNIQNNPDLAKLAEYLTNFCEIKLENYPTAISWFENVIQNPETIEDSIFAIIDLGYTYFLIENGGLKSAYSGKMIEHIPVSKKQFEEKRDYLLTLLYKDSKISENLENKLNTLKEGELLQNFPNPFSGLTDIFYKLDKEYTVGIYIYDYSGRLIKTINGKGAKGLNKVQFDSSGLPSGIYLYNLEINGSLNDSRKMTILK